MVLFYKKELFPFLRIACPHCGERALQEFAYHGDATIRRPADDAAEGWADYVYLRDNPAGLHNELWYHAAGCHAWLVVTRDLRSHEITKTIAARGAA